MLHDYVSSGETLRTIAHLSGLRVEDIPVHYLPVNAVFGYRLIPLGKNVKNVGSHAVVEKRVRAGPRGRRLVLVPENSFLTPNERKGIRRLAYMGGAALGHEIKREGPTKRTKA